MLRREHWITSLALAALFGCGGSSTKTPMATPEVDVRSGAPAAMTASMVEALDAGGTVALLGSTGAHHVLAVVGGEIYEVSAGMLVHRSLYAEGMEPMATGAIHAIAPRAAGGAWIAADRGTFLLDTLYVTAASFSTGMGAVRSASEVTTGPLTGLWIAGDDGLFKRSGDDLTKYDIAGAGGALGAVAVESTGNAALVLAGQDAILLESDGSKITSDRPQLAAGAINAVAAGTSVLYAASDSGVLRYSPNAKAPKWTRFTLSADGMAPKKVTSLAVDPVSGAVWMNTESGILRLLGDDLAALDASMIDSASVPAIAVDQTGDVWTANPTKLEHVGTNSMAMAVTFSKDLSPWLGMHCTQCHGNQTQNFQTYEVFAPLAEMALMRVQSGDMPRCDGGLPCPPEKHLMASDYAPLEQWIRAGKPK